MKNRILVITESPNSGCLYEPLSGDATEVYIMPLGDSIKALERSKYCLVLIYGQLPDISLLDFVKALRGMTNAPVILLVDESLSKDEQYALIAAGAMYVLNYKDQKAIYTCARSAVKRYLNIIATKENENPVDPIIVCKDLLIDPSKRLVKVKNKGVNLCRKEFDLLYYLGLHQGEVVTKDQIASNVWPYLVGDNTIISHIGRIRRKIEPDPSAPIYITTYPGVGYSMTSGN